MSLTSQGKETSSGTACCTCEIDFFQKPNIAIFTFYHMEDPKCQLSVMLYRQTMNKSVIILMYDWILRMDGWMDERTVSETEHQVVSVKRSSSVYQTTLRPGISV